MVSLLGRPSSPDIAAPDLVSASKKPLTSRTSKTKPTGQASSAAAFVPTKPTRVTGNY